MEQPAASIVNREFGASAEVVGRIDEGLIHDTYEVRFEDGDVVLQIASPTEEHEDSLRQGLHCYLLLQDTAIPVPRVITRTVQEWNGRTYVLVEKLPGATATLDISPRRVRNAGRVLAKLHASLSFERAGWFRFDDHGVSIEGFQEGSYDAWRHRTVQDNAEYLQAGGLETAGRAIKRVFSQVRLEAEDARGTVLCHNDYSPDNVLFHDDEVTGVIDFDHAYAGARHRDIVKTANSFWMHDPGVNWDVRSTFYEGYTTVTELDASFEESEPMVRAETLAVLVGGMARMGELSAYETDFYAERILEAIDRTSLA